MIIQEYPTFCAKALHGVCKVSVTSALVVFKLTFSRTWVVWCGLILERSGQRASFSSRALSIANFLPLYSFFP